MRWINPLRSLPGAAFGAGLASLAEAALPGGAAAPSFGPPSVILFGFDVPILSAIFGLIGVLLARRVAPATVAGSALGRVGNAALSGLLVMGVLALIVSGEKRPIVALAWAIGLGFSGLGFIELVARAVVTGTRLIMDAFVAIATKGAAAWAERRGGEQ